MPTALSDLPPEVLGQIVSHVDSAQALCSLSLTCKDIRDVVQTDGFRIFVKSRFPSFSFSYPAQESSNAQQSLFWKEAAHAMTSLSRNWDRRSLLIRLVIHPHQLFAPRIRQAGGQTMGFVPVIDSHQSWTSGNWNSRKDVLAWGAGRTLFIRSKSTRTQDRNRHGDRREPRYVWREYCPENLLEGKDDITAVHLLAQPEGRPEQCVIGRASGGFERISLGGASTGARITRFETNGKPVRSSAIDRPSGLLAACLSDTTISFFDTKTDDKVARPVQEITVQKPNNSYRTWTCQFLNSRRLAVGFGTSTKPLQIFDPEQGRSKEPTREIEIQGANATNDKDQHATSVYSIAPLPDSAASEDVRGDLFLTGMYDSRILLHDLRCAKTVVSTFNDPVDSNAVYSLLPIGREKIVAGSAKHALIKILDLRLAGEKRYASTLLQPHYSREKCKGRWTNKVWNPDQVWDPSTRDEFPPSHLGPTVRLHHPHIMTSQDWNVYLALPPSARNPRGTFESPVYSLSRPSSTAPTFYAGAEQKLFQVDLLSLVDQHPDPFFTHGPSPTSSTPSTRLMHLPEAWQRHMAGFAPSGRQNAPRHQHPHQRSILSHAPGSHYHNEHASRYRRHLTDRFISWDLHPDEILNEPMINQNTESASCTQMWYQQSVGDTVRQLSEDIAVAATTAAAAAADTTSSGSEASGRPGTRRLVLDERWKQITYR